MARDVGIDDLHAEETFAGGIGVACGLLVSVILALLILPPLRLYKILMLLAPPLAGGTLGNRLAKNYADRRYRPRFLRWSDDDREAGYSWKELSGQ